MSRDQLIARLTEAFSDRQLHLVGGCLRDELLGRPSRDLDLATDALPDEVRRRVEPWADAVWLVGEKFGTVGLEYAGVKAEITTFRTDTYDGISRKPEVAFGSDLAADLARRDFTINAMARDLHTGKLADPHGGRRDLRERSIRFVGEPAARIAEDPLRMLRAVRFCAALGFELDPAAAAAIAGAADELCRISHERIRDELDGVLLSPHPAEGLRLMLSLGLARHALPELLNLHLPEPTRHHMKDLLDHTLDTVAHVPARLALRYAALLHDIAKPETLSEDEGGVHFYRHEVIGAERAREVLRRLRQPESLVEETVLLIRHHLRIPYYRPEWSPSAVRRLMYDLGDRLEDAIALADADVRASEPSDYPDFARRLEELRRRAAEIGEAGDLARMRPLLNGEEVMALLGIAPGPRVGEALRFLLEEQIEGRVSTPEEAREALRRRFRPGAAEG